MDGPRKKDESTCDCSMTQLESVFFKVCVEKEKGVGDRERVSVPGSLQQG